MTKLRAEARGKTSVFWQGAIYALAMVWASPVFADCTSPAGTAGLQIYNTTYQTMQFCNGSMWINMGLSGAATALGAVTANNFCTASADGTQVICGTAAIDLANKVTGNLPVTNLGSGTNASATTFWRGDAVWAALSMPDGTAGVPGLPFTNDATTGLYRPATGNVGLSTSGVERLRVTATGSMGVGTQTPASPLEVNGRVKANSVYYAGVSGSAGAISGTATGLSGMVQFNNGSNSFGGDSALVWDNTNKRLGVGTASPVSPLTVQTATLGTARFFSTGSGRAFIVVANTSGNNNSGVVDLGGNTASWEIGTDYNADKTSNFFMYDYASSAVRLFITATGSVGIGTTTPSERLDLGGGNISMGYETKGCPFAAATSGWQSCVCSSGKRVLGASCRTGTNGIALGFDLIDNNNGGANTGASCYKTTTSETAVMYIACANIR